VKSVYSSAMQAARFSNSLASSSVHQSVRLPLGANFRPWVVEAVRELVADHGADAAEVHRVVHHVLVERRLQDAGREVDVVLWNGL